MMNMINMFARKFTDIMKESLSEYKPSNVFVSYSGGTDSAVVLQLALESDFSFQVMTIDTGIGSKGHLPRIYNDIYLATGKYPITYTGAGLCWYLQNVRDYGFGYTPSQHSIYYRMLKARAIRTMVRDYKTHRHDRIMFVTGVRRLESIKRRTTPYHMRSGSQVTVNAIADYTDAMKQKVLDRATWFNGKTTHDCLCNWTLNHTVDEFHTSIQSDIHDLNDEMKSLGMWTYGNKPDGTFGLDTDSDDDMPVDSFCVNCRQLELWQS